MATMQEEIQKYKAQTQQYDAGRPNTAAPQKQAAQFQPAESAGMAMPAPARQPVAPSGHPPRWTPGEVGGAVGRELGDDARAVGSAVMGGLRAIKDVGGKVTGGEYLASPNTGREFGVTRPPVAMSQGQPAQAPQLTPDQQVHADVQKEVADSQAWSKMSAMTNALQERQNPTPTPDQIKKAILEKNGLINQTPVTARPGTTLSATPETPRKPLAYNGAFAGGGPEVRAQEALQRKQMEVMAAERADKSLLYAPGSRDYISPTLTEPQQRARQAEIATQRKQDGEDVAAQQVNNATIKSLDDQAKGITSDRNLGMLPYAERRAAINNRDGLMDLNASMQQKRIDDAAKAADRTAGTERAQMEDSTKRAEIEARVGIEGQKLTSEERRAQMEDSTKRRGQDLEQDTLKANAEISAQQKALDREATIKAAQIRAPQVKDPVMLEKIKGYNAAVANLYSLPGATVTPDMLEQMKATFGLAGADTSMAGVNPEEDPDFLN